MTKSTPFWQSVRELAAMRGHIPEERREMSGVRDAIRSDVRVERANLSTDSTEQQNARRG
jgi:hypothetical protein